MNAFITTPNKEKIWTLGPKFGNDNGHKLIIVRALNGLKLAGATFGNHLADFMRQIGHESNKANQDL